MNRLVGTVKMSLVSQLYSSPLMTSVADRGFIMTAPTPAGLSPPCRNALLPPAEHLLIPAHPPPIYVRGITPVMFLSRTMPTPPTPASVPCPAVSDDRVSPPSSPCPLVSDDRVSPPSSPCPAVSDDRVSPPHSDAVWLRGWPRPSLSCVTVNNFRTTASIHLKNSQNRKWLWVNCSQLLWSQVMSGQWPTTIVITTFGGVSGYRPLAGRGAKSPQPITPKPMVAAIRARRWSKALRETLPMNALKQFSELVLKFKVRSNVKNIFV